MLGVERIKPSIRLARLLSALTSVGFGIAALVFAGIKIVPYALALIPLMLIILLRRVLPESQRFEREQREGTSPATIMVPVKALDAS